MYIPAFIRRCFARRRQTEFAGTGPRQPHVVDAGVTDMLAYRILQLPITHGGPVPNAPIPELVNTGEDLTFVHANPFAAESHDVIPAAQRKLARKGCDFIVANDVSRGDAGFNVDDNAVSFVWPEGEVEELALLSKDRVASEILDRVEKLLGGRS